MDAANKIKDKGLARKLTTAVVGAIVLLSAGLVIIAAVVFTDIKATMKEVLYDVTLDSYKSVISSEVQSAISITENYYELAQSGELPEAEAQKKAMEVIRSIRYGDDNSGYLWIDGTDYTLLMHPILPDQEGNNRYELTDQNDVKIIQEIMKVAKEGGYNEFYFTKSDGVTVAPKVAYSKEFEPWNWVITTGVYSDDIQNIVDNSNGVIQIGQIFNQSLGLMAGMAALFAVIIAIVAYILIKKIILVIDKVKVQLTRVAQGDLTGKLEGKIAQRNDELGAMVRNTNIAMDAFRNSMLSVKNTTDAVESGSTDMKEKTENAVNANEQVATAIGNVAAEVSQQAFQLLESRMPSGDGFQKATLVIGTVKGDIHDIGKNMVAVMVKNHGYRVIDLGKNVPAETFVDAVLEYNAEFLGLSPDDHHHAGDSRSDCAAAGKSAADQSNCGWCGYYGRICCRSRCRRFWP